MRRVLVRGQALVLFALVLLVVVLAMIATLSLSHLTHQKMELQVANDTAAYSQAVAAARTYNSVALLNRAQTATMVALQGIHTAVSFAGTYRGSINAAIFAYMDDFTREFGDCGDPNTWPSQYNFTGQQNTGFGSRNACELVDRVAVESNCNQNGRGARPLFSFGFFFNFGCVGRSCDAREEIVGNMGSGLSNCFAVGNGRIPLLKREWCRVARAWNVLDQPVGEQGREAQAQAVAIGELERVALEDTLPGALSRLATSSMNTVGATANVRVAREEFARSFAGGGSHNGLEAALGSRAHLFISQRDDGARAIEEQLERVLEPSGAGPNEVQIRDLKGCNFFVEPDMWDARYESGHCKRAADTAPRAYASWSDEHAIVSVSYEGTYSRAPNNQRTPGVSNERWERKFKGSSSATDRQNVGDTHFWCPADLNAEQDEPWVTHTLLPHRMPPPHEYDPCENSSCIWSGFYDIDALIIANPDDVFGQPKLLTVASKDLAGQKNPWNMFFNYRFARTGSGQQIDFTAKHAVKGVMPEFQSLSAGMAYYHRPGHWKEHPNLFNPYWRATLVRANVDTGWQGHITNNIAGVNSDAFNALVGAGYKGIP